MKLGDMSSLSLEDRRGYLTLVIFCQKEGRLVVRKTEGIREWHDCLELFLARSKTAEKVKMESTERFWDRVLKFRAETLPVRMKGSEYLRPFLLQLVYTHIGICL